MEGDEKMNEAELPGILRRMSVETGSLVCLGCGYERSCSIRGCAILNDAAAAIERLLDERSQRREFPQPETEKPTAKT